MESGLDMVKRLSFKEPGAKEEGYIIRPILKDRKKIDDLIYYHIMCCSKKEALEEEQAWKKRIHKGAKVVVLKVILEVI